MRDQPDCLLLPLTWQVLYQSFNTLTLTHIYTYNPLMLPSTMGWCGGEVESSYTTQNNAASNNESLSSNYQEEFTAVWEAARH